MYHCRKIPPNRAISPNLAITNMFYLAYRVFENAENRGVPHINMYFQIFLKHQLTPHGSNHLSWMTDASLTANDTDTRECHTLF